MFFNSKTRLAKNNPELTVCSTVIAFPYDLVCIISGLISCMLARKLVQHHQSHDRKVNLTLCIGIIRFEFLQLT